MRRYLCGRLILAGLGMLSLVASPARVEADDPKPGIDATTAFEALAKGLTGTWKPSGAPPDAGDTAKITYRVTAGGSLLVEDMFPGSQHEMITVYHRDGDELILTHYCAIGNQPRMKLDRKASTAKDLRFVFDGGTNFDPAKDGHMHDCRIELVDPSTVKATWTYYQDGKQTSEEVFTATKQAAK